MTAALVLVVIALLALLTLVSYVSRVYEEAGKFLSREFQENIDLFEQQVEPRLRVNRARIRQSMAVLAQLFTAALAMLMAYFVFSRPWTGAEVAEAALVMVLIVIIFHRLLPYVLFSRTRGSWVAPFAIVLRILVYLILPVTLVLNFAISVASLTREHPPEEPEHPSEAVDALIEAGQEEGILEEGDRELIQSVVEFGDTTVREVMTPRPDIFSVPASTTIQQFKELLRKRPFSRVPVFQDTIDTIVGIVFAHDVLQVTDAEASSVTVGGLMRPAQFVPESQRVSSVLREMQKENVHMAIVIDEYGGVAGVVTIEDLVEEIVGEIRDEHEAKSDVLRESENSYIVPGNLDADRLEELFGVRKSEEREATTVGGLVSEILGRIPSPGERAEEGGLRYEVLESTARRIQKLRVSRVPPHAAETTQPAAPPRHDRATG
jgi:putative hemolysin